MRFVLAVGTTETATIDGISAAGASPELARHTPAADAEIVEYGRPVRAPSVPVSPSGCPTPAVVTRAVRELVGFDLLAVDAGLGTPTAAPTVCVGARPGGDVREPDPVPTAGDAFDSARDLARALPDDELVIAESVPGGTTTALGVLTALGEPYGVSSSLPENPVALKRSVVSAGLDASGLAAGDAAGDPVRAIRSMGDPVLAVVAGLGAGALERGADVTLAGGTQMAAAAALIRHAGIDAALRVATTPFVVDDGSAEIERAAGGIGFDLAVADPGFDRADHAAMARYLAGEAKEGVGMGGALWLADRAGVPMADVRERIVERYETLVNGHGP